MDNHTQQKSTSVNQRILETTLVAVRDKNAQRRKNKRTASCSVLALLAIAAFLLLRPAPPATGDDTIASSDPTLNNPTHPLANHANFEVSMAVNGGVKTIDISPSDLAKIVFNPNVKFTQKEDAYIWIGQSTRIHMNLPTTSMAITDTRYLPSTLD